MALAHNSTLAKSEPNWGSIDKVKLPRNAHADMGDVDKESSWRYPHHFVIDGKTGGKNDVYVKGAMHLHKGGLKAALQAAGGARSGKKESNPSVKRHLTAHANAIDMSKKETASLLNISVNSLMDFLKNDNININNNDNIGGENPMGMTYEELETKVKDSEKTVSEKEATIATMTTAAETAKANAESLEDEIVKYKESEGKLQDSVDDLKKDAKDNAIFIKAGKQFIEDTKAEIHKISVQVDGNDYNKDLVDKQLVAFGIDLEALGQFKVNLENRRAKLLKTGDLEPEEILEDDKKVAKAANDDIKLGESLVPSHLRIVKK